MTAPLRPPSPTAPWVTVHLWSVPSRQVPLSLHAMGARAWRRDTPGLQFAKLAGTAPGGSFSLAAASLHSWLAVCAWTDRRCADRFDDSEFARGWQSRATETLRLELRPLASIGSWAGRRPFGAANLPAEGAESQTPPRLTGPVAALTRARLRPGRALRFWRAIPDIAAQLPSGPGARGPVLALGLSEFPLVMQGTFTLWQSVQELTDFAYRTPAHAAAIRDTARARWYAESLFTRFEVVGCTGSWAGRNPLPRCSGQPATRSST